MLYDPSKHHRHTIRLEGYDYSQGGGYFITLDVENKACLFGQVVGGEMQLYEAGSIVREEWLRTPEVRPEIVLDEFIIMPNHLHGIVFISEPIIVGADGRPPPSASRQPVPGRVDSRRPLRHNLRRQPRSLGSFIAGVKSITTKRINKLRSTAGVKIWQRKYYEHIIRGEKDLQKIRAYIFNNPSRGSSDEANPDCRL